MKEEERAVGHERNGRISSPNPKFGTGEKAETLELVTAMMMMILRILQRGP
jgi:hypothetical protein